jgi:hypothetical protein
VHGNYSLLLVEAAILWRVYDGRVTTGKRAQLFYLMDKIATLHTGEAVEFSFSNVFADHFPSHQRTLP